MLNALDELILAAEQLRDRAALRDELLVALGRDEGPTLELDILVLRAAIEYVQAELGRLADGA